MGFKTFSPPATEALKYFRCSAQGLEKIIPTGFLEAAAVKMAHAPAAFVFAFVSGSAGDLNFTRLASGSSQIPASLDLYLNPLVPRAKI